MKPYARFMVQWRKNAQKFYKRCERYDILNIKFQQNNLAQEWIKCKDKTVSVWMLIINCYVFGDIDKEINLMYKIISIGI